MIQLPLAHLIWYKCAYAPLQFFLYKEYFYCFFLLVNASLVFRSCLENNQSNICYGQNVMGLFLQQVNNYQVMFPHRMLQCKKNHYLKIQNLLPSPTASGPNILQQFPTCSERSVYKKVVFEQLVSLLLTPVNPLGNLVFI